MLRLISAGLGALLILVGAVSAQAAPEKKKIVIGLPVNTVTFTPLYIADKEGYFTDEGLEVELVAFRGGTNLVRGLIAGNVDIGITSLAGIGLAIKAGQPLKAFYAGFNMAVFDWYAVKDITTFKQLKGKRIGVASLGSSTDFLTRYALQLNGIDPEKDVQIIAGGSATDRMPAMEAGQLDANIVATPAGYILADRGFNHVLSQKDIAPDYPYHLFFASESFIKDNPDTIRAVLRGTIRGIRKAKEDKALAAQVMVERVGYEQRYAELAYGDFIDSIFEDGRMPSQAGMKAFWEIGMLGGLYEKPLPEEKYLDRTFLDTYEEWKPGD